MLIAGIESTHADAAKPLWYGRDLAKLCGAKDGSGEYGMCFSFVSAVLEIAADNSVDGIKACIPPLVTASQAVEITRKWLSSHQDEAMQPASLAVMNAFARQFACPRN